jgi:pimeloyl-ACP methyl ester carboxylesterase
LKDWKLEDYVADLAQMVDEVGQDPILVGHSMGATVSQIFASQHRVVGMALLCPIPMRGYHDDAVRLFKVHPWITFLAEVGHNAGRLVEDEGLVRHLLLSEKVPDKDVCRYYCQLQGESLKAIRQCVDGVGTPSSCQGLPVLVIGREGDGVVSPQSVHRCADLCHVCEVMVPGSGHDIMLDWGWERAAESVLEWADAL